jgi:hypothetical protein
MFVSRNTHSAPWVLSYSNYQGGSRGGGGGRGRGRNSGQSFGSRDVRYNQGGGGRGMEPVHVIADYFSCVSFLTVSVQFHEGSSRGGGGGGGFGGGYQG